MLTNPKLRSCFPELTEKQPRSSELITGFFLRVLMHLFDCIGFTMKKNTPVVLVDFSVKIKGILC